jgi:hypothetical protein
VTPKFGALSKHFDAICELGALVFYSVREVPVQYAGLLNAILQLMNWQHACALSPTLPFYFFGCASAASLR